MPQPPATSRATASAAASPTPGAGSPVLAAWLHVRRRNILLSFAKRRYVVLTDDHVLLVDNTPVLHLVDCRITSHSSAHYIDLTPNPAAGLAVRIFTDSPFQFNKWLLALKTTSESSFRRFYQLDLHTFLGAGVHGIVRSALPQSPPREYSIDSSTCPSESNSRQEDGMRRYFPRRRDRSAQRRLTATRPSAPISNPNYSTHSDDPAYSDQLQPHSPAQSCPVPDCDACLSKYPHDTHLRDWTHNQNSQHSQQSQQSQQSQRSNSQNRRNRMSDGATAEPLARTRSRDFGRRLFKRRILSMAAGRSSVDIDPDSRNNPNTSADVGVPSTKRDKRFFRQKSLSKTDPIPDTSIVPSITSVTSATPNPITHRDLLHPVAVKTISRTGNGCVTVASELLFALSRLNHFAIIKVLDVFQAVGDVHIVMELCAGGSVFEYVQRHGLFSERDARTVFTPIVKAVGYLHASGIVHWDVNPTNVLLLSEAPPFEPKLIDFGTARPIDPSNGRVLSEYPVFAEKGKVASLACASPELLTSKAHRYAAKADMWQLGCMLYFLLFGELPFSRKAVQNDGTLSSRILTFCKQRSPQRREFLFGREMANRAQLVSEDAKILIVKLLCPNPRMRPNALQCLREFRYLVSSKSPI